MKAAVNLVSHSPAEVNFLVVCSGIHSTNNIVLHFYKISTYLLILFSSFISLYVLLLFHSLTVRPLQKSDVEQAIATVDNYDILTHISH